MHSPIQSAVSPTSAPIVPGSKSTTVRATRPRPPALRVVGAALRTLEATSPRAAAKVAEHLMFRTQRMPPSKATNEVMGRATRFHIPSSRGELAAWRWGSGRPVLLAHGWNGRASQLASLVDPLLARGLAVVAYDAPGHGESPGSVSSLFHFADAVDAAIDAIRQPFGQVEAIIAHSMGGAAVTYAMSRHRRAPGTARERALQASGLPAKRFAFVAPPIDVADFVRGVGKLFGLGEAFELALRARVEARFGIALADVYAPDLARELEAPLLVVHDEDDREVPIDRGRALVEAWPGARLEVTRGLGHVRILRDAGVVEQIAAFAEGGDDRRRTAA